MWTSGEGADRSSRDMQGLLHLREVRMVAGGRMDPSCGAPSLIGSCSR
jgi:hypothetical protein